MIEAGNAHFLCPTRGVVAGLATRHEAALVRVCVTWGALVERKSHIFNERLLGVRDGPMTFVAGDCDMCPSKGEF